MLSGLSHFVIFLVIKLAVDLSTIVVDHSTIVVDIATIVVDLSTIAVVDIASTLSFPTIPLRSAITFLSVIDFSAIFAFVLALV